MSKDRRQYPHQPPHVVYQQGPTVSRTRVSGGAHTVHLLLTVFTCGMWAPFWLLHWLLGRSKTTTR